VHRRTPIAVAELDNLTATTIHGFCQAVIRSHSAVSLEDPDHA
jgi:hypothetical protein